MSEQKIKEYDQDIEELRTLFNQATRLNVRQYLNTQLQEIERLRKLEEERLNKLKTQPSNQTPLTGYTKKIDTFGWDQSEKFVKIYITSLNDVNKVKQEDIVSNFTPNSSDVTIKNLNNVNYNISFLNLANKIVPSESYVKKADVGKQWNDLKPVKEKPMPKLDENADPQDGLMSIMKKMYEEGDDEMKRTISKAYIESREKSTNNTADFPL